ncbi:MAG: hypothetical protein WC470_02045 [Candidatus Paceibacterota bacterium]
MAAKKRKFKNIISLLPVMVVILSALYVFQIAEFTQSEYNISQREKEIATLKKENSTLQLSVSQSKNLVNFEDKITQSGYNKVDRIDYLIIPSDSLASK